MEHGAWSGGKWWKMMEKKMEKSWFHQILLVLNCGLWAVPLRKKNQDVNVKFPVSIGRIGPKRACRGCSYQPCFFRCYMSYLPWWVGCTAFVLYPFTLHQCQFQDSAVRTVLIAVKPLIQRQAETGPFPVAADRAFSRSSGQIFGLRSRGSSRPLGRIAPCRRWVGFSGTRFVGPGPHDIKKLGLNLWTCRSSNTSKESFGRWVPSSLWFVDSKWFKHA